MGQPFGDSVGSVDNPGSEGYSGGQGDQSQGNPAWKPFLDVVPQELHQQVTPVLQQWDEGVNKRFEKVHSEYAPYKPFIEAGFKPEDIQFSLNLANALSTNPEEVYRAIGEMYGFNSKEAKAAAAATGQGQGETSQEDQYFDPRFDQLKHQSDLMAQVIIKERQEREYQSAVAAEEAALEKELTDAKKKFGDFDEEDVLLYMSAGLSVEDAIKRHQANVYKHAPKPLFATGGGGLPGTGTPPKNMTDSQTNAFVAQMLEAAQRQRNQP